MMPTSPSSDGAAGAAVGQTASGGQAAGAGDVALDLGYTVTVDSFSGPLDLLLYLVRRTELDILEVPLSLIVDQFVDTVRSWQDADLDVAGEFILMAATLLEFKARTIAPPLDQPEEGAEDEPMFDPRESLLRSLLAYRRFKEAAQGLGELEEARRPLLERQVREHIPEAPPEEGDFDLGEVDLNLLATTCERILSRIGGLGPRTVVVDEMPLGVRIATMLDELTVRERATISELLAGNHSRVVHITTVMATLELARQRFVEVEQTEQFGEIALRLRSSEERERTPELPPPEPEGPKRRRKLPLVTFTAPPSATTSDDEVAESEVEDHSETDEQRFLRELEEATRVTAVLAITANVEKSFTEHWYTLHPELRPVAPPPAAVPEPTVKRFPPRRSSPAPAAPANESPAVPTETPVTTPVTSEVVVAAPAGEIVAVTAETTPGPVAEAATETSATIAAELVVSSPVETAPPAADQSVVASLTTEAVAAVEAPAPEAPPAEAPATITSTVVADPIPVVADTTDAVSSAVAVTSPSNEAPASTTTDEVAHPEEQRVLPVEQWPVMHAQPAPEETPHPLDTITSDDPAAVNALLSGEPPRPTRHVHERDEDEEHEEDPDELLADDPALVNAALQADTPRFPAERSPEPELTIPTATETSVWTAPVDRGQTVSDVSDDNEPPSAELASPIAAEPSPLAEAPVEVEPTTAAHPLIEQPSETVASEFSTPHEDEELEPDEQEDVADPALIDAAQQADTPRPSVTLHPAHELTIPTATETSVWTAPVDRGQTAAEVEDEPEVSAEVAACDDSVTAAVEPSPAASAPSTPVEEPVVAVVEPAAVASVPATPSPVEPVVAAAEASPAAVASAPSAPPVVEPAVANTEPVAVTSAPATPIDEPVVAGSETSAVVSPPRAPDADVIPAVAVSDVASASVPDANPPSLSEAPPSSTPIMLEPSAQSSAAAVVAGTAALAATETPAALVSDGAVAEAPPPPEDGPPQAAPPPPAPPPPRFESPLPAPTTTPTPSRPMSPPPRSKAWLLIALFIAINVGWAVAMWLTWLPRDVLEIAATEQGGDAEHPTLVWRFNLDVVDAEAQAKPPELVPVITPALPGRWSWTGPRSLVFEAAGPLPLATTFTATLPVENFRTVHGFGLRTAGVQTWSTPALAISGAAVETFDRDGTTIALTFNQPVDPQVIVQELSVEITPADIAAIDAEASDQAASDQAASDQAASDQPSGADGEPAVASTVVSVAEGESADTASEPSIVSNEQPVGDSEPADAGNQPAASNDVVDASTVDEQPVTSASASAGVRTPVVLAISTNSATTVRLRLAVPVRGHAVLRLPAGTVGVAGPLGLVEPWEQQVPLQQTLHLTQGEVVVPSHGDVRIDVAVSDPAAPRELLAPVVSVEPAVPVTVSTSDTGVTLVGDFVPGQRYRIAVGATWPDDPTTSGHVLSAYTAASDITVTIPERPAGIWPLGTEVVDGHQHLAAHAVARADVLLLRGSDEECVASREVAWSEQLPATLDIDELTQDQPAASYRLRVTSGGEIPVVSDQTLVVEHLPVRPQALFAAMTEWAIAALSGAEDADVPVRVVRLVER